MVAGLRRRRVVGAREPSARQLLDRGDVDDPVVQKALEGGHVAAEERSVRGDGVAGERWPAGLGAVLTHIAEHLLLCLFERRAVVEDLEQSRRGVHLADEVIHLGERLCRGFDHHVDPVPEDVEVEVGDQSSHLDEGVGLDAEPRHLAVDPHQTVIHSCTLPTGRADVACGFCGQPWGRSRRFPRVQSDTP